MERDNNSRPNTLINRKFTIIGLILVAVVALAIALLLPKTEQPELISLSQVANSISNGQVVKIEDSISVGDFTVYLKDGKILKGVRDPNSSLLDQLSLLGVKGDQLSQVQFDVLRSTPPIANSPLGVLVIGAFIGIPIFAAYRLSKKDRMGKKDFAEVEVPTTRFSDVAGLDENLQELRDIVSFLKDGNKYAEIGAKMPRGILMIGDPGTGKTLIAKAVAGEAEVPFFAMSGSEFVEVYVGVGASRIRSLFEKARKKAPCIIFLDEIDAVGRERHRSESGAEMEADQTLNQLLVEMDGFDSTDGILVLAATNRIDVLDSALTRPGRFDRQLHVYRPDVKGRQEILAIHSKGKKLAPDVSLENIAKATPGLVGADLANIVNEAAIIAVRQDRKEIRMHDFEEAFEKSMAGGVQQKNRVMNQDERKIIAYHEAGHAIVIHDNKLSDPVYKITIIPRGQTGGYTMSLPEQDSILMSKCKFMARITGLMGGRAAEEIFFGDITSGASNDLQVATQIAEEMVMRLGMDRGSGLRVYPAPNGYAALAGPRNSQKTFEAIDEAVNNILDTCYTDAKRILTEKRFYVDQLANELLEVETINRERFIELMESESGQTQAPQ